MHGSVGHSARSARSPGQTKRKLLDECNLYCIVSRPGGVFSAAGGGVKRNLLFFNKGEPTEKTWYYDLADVKVGKRQPFTIDKFDECFRLLPKRADSERSWTVNFAERKQQATKEAEHSRKRQVISPRSKGSSSRSRPKRTLSCTCPRAT